MKSLFAVLVALSGWVYYADLAQAQVYTYSSPLYSSYYYASPMYSYSPGVITADYTAYPTTATYYAGAPTYYYGSPANYYDTARYSYAPAYYYRWPGYYYTSKDYYSLPASGYYYNYPGYTDYYMRSPYASWYGSR
jgi:hypothetical protein